MTKRPDAAVAQARDRQLDRAAHVSELRVLGMVQIAELVNRGAAAPSSPYDAPAPTAPRPIRERRAARPLRRGVVVTRARRLSHRLNSEDGELRVAARTRRGPVAGGNT